MDDFSRRFEIRQLGPEHLEWTCALMAHSHMFCGPVFSPIYPPDQRTERAYDVFKALLPMTEPRLTTGLSYGVFDKEYTFKRKPGGGLYWDMNDLAATSEQLLEQMDFPLVSVVQRYDASSTLDMGRLEPLLKVYPLLGQAVKRQKELTTDDPSTGIGPGKIIKWGGTATRADFMGFGIMKKLTHALMSNAADLGFEGIMIHAVHDAVIHVWMNPPEPSFKSKMLSSFRINEMEEEEENGKKVIPYPDMEQLSALIYVSLK